MNESKLRPVEWAEDARENALQNMWQDAQKSLRAIYELTSKHDDVGIDTIDAEKALYDLRAIHNIASPYWVKPYKRNERN